MEKKFIIFNHFIDRLLEINKGVNNDLSMLKVQKLLFLTTIASILNDKSDNLLKYFEFQAWQYGPVESEIYINYSKSNQNKFIISSDGSPLNINPNYREGSRLSSEEIKMVNSAIETLLKINSKILDTNPFILVDITHEYNSWKFNYKVGEKKVIPKEHILNDKRIFSN